MRQDLVEKYPQFFEKIITETAIAFGSNVRGYVVGKASVKKKEVVAEREQKVLHRYGVHLTPNGEAFVYQQIRKIADLFQKEEGMDKYDAERAAKDIMCLHLLKEAFNIAHIPFVSNYEKQIARRDREFKLKMFGFILGLVLVLIVIGVFITLLLTGNL